VPSFGSPRSHWPVVAWVRLKLPPPAPPMMLIAGPPPPLDPPLERLTKNPVATDPRKQVYAFEEDREDSVVRLFWDADDPEVLEAELRAPGFGRRPTSAEIRGFWDWVRATVAPIGPLPVEAADPRP
jgi:hypothetical protein